MNRLGVFTVQCDAILENAAALCYERASHWCNEEQMAHYRKDSDQAAIFKARRDEADECRFVIRGLKSKSKEPVSEIEVLKNAVLLLGTLTHCFDRAEYRQGYEIFSSMYSMMGGDTSWPFPIQPSTPPFEPRDDSKKAA